MFEQPKEVILRPDSLTYGRVPREKQEEAARIMAKAFHNIEPFAAAFKLSEEDIFSIGKHIAKKAIDIDLLFGAFLSDGKLVSVVISEDKYDIETADKPLAEFFSHNENAKRMEDSTDVYSKDNKDIYEAKKPGEVLHFYTFATLPEYWGNGIFTKLFDFVMSDSEVKKYKRIIIEAGSFSTQKVAKRFGFRTVFSKFYKDWEDFEQRNELILPCIERLKRQGMDNEKFELLLLEQHSQ